MLVVFGLSSKWTIQSWPSKKGLKVSHSVSIFVTHSMVILTKQTVGLQEVVQEAVAHISIKEVETGEQVMKRRQLATLDLKKAK